MSTGRPRDTPRRSTHARPRTGRVRRSGRGAEDVRRHRGGDRPWAQTGRHLFDDSGPDGWSVAALLDGRAHRCPGEVAGGEVGGRRGPALKRQLLLLLDGEPGGRQIGDPDGGVGEAVRNRREEPWRINRKGPLQPCLQRDFEAVRPERAQVLNKNRRRPSTPPRGDAPAPWPGPIDGRTGRSGPGRSARAGPDPLIGRNQVDSACPCDGPWAGKKGHSRGVAKVNVGTAVSAIAVVCRPGRRSA